jgi:hypothetical protein
MRFAFLSLGLLIGSASASPIASPLEARKDNSVIDAYLTRMSADLQALKHTLKTLPTGGSRDVANQKALTLLDQLRTFGRTMESGIVPVKAGPAVNSVEALTLVGEVSSMTSLVSDVNTGFMQENTKKLIWVAGKKEAQNRFAQELTKNAKLHDHFSAALISKLPVLNQGLAGVMKSGFGAIAQPAIAVSLFSQTRCRNKG